ncbi:MAG: hypothetical protein WDO73_02100 [Ignavibacteriota bacterium]
MLQLRDMIPLPSPGELPRPTADDAIAAVNTNWRTFSFAYDQSKLSPDANIAFRHDVALLRAILLDFPQLQVTVEGYCKEHGSAEYNLGLGDRRTN